MEALTPEFGEKFWEFIVAGKYRNKATNGGKPQFYRFDKPENELFPKMIELFCRTDDIRKHKKDILRISAELMLEKVDNLPAKVKEDIARFIDILEANPFDDNSLKAYGLKNDDIVRLLRDRFA